MAKLQQYKAYNAITFCENTTEQDLYDLFGESIGVLDENGKEVPDYFKTSQGRNGHLNG